MRPPAAELPPYRVFFCLAALGGAGPVGVAVTSALGFTPPVGGPLIGAWHAHEMIFGHFAAAFAGVLLTALPRWTGRPPLAPRTVVALAIAWVVARLAFLLVGVDETVASQLARGASAVFVLGLAVVAVRDIVAGGDRRDAVVPALLVLLGASDLLVALDLLSWDLALRLALGCALGVATLMGGRILPALTRHLGKSRGREPNVTTRPWLERMVIAVTALALAAWIGWPYASATAWILFAAAVVHVARLAGWCGWTTIRRPSFLGLHLGYAFMPLGFGFAGLGIALGDSRLVDAGLHAWGAGVLGLMCGAIQASVIRRHGGRALEIDRLADLACAGFFIAAVARTAAPFAGEISLSMICAAVAWWCAQTALLVSTLRRPSVEAA